MNVSSVCTYAGNQGCAERESTLPRISKCQKNSDSAVELLGKSKTLLVKETAPLRERSTLETIASSVDSVLDAATAATLGLVLPSNLAEPKAEVHQPWFIPYQTGSVVPRDMVWTTAKGWCEDK